VVIDLESGGCVLELGPSRWEALCGQELWQKETLKVEGDTRGRSVQW